MGHSLTKLQPIGGFCAETGGGVTILALAQLGIPVSTTHTITGAIVGVGSTKGARAVQLGRGRPHHLGLDLHHPRLGHRGGADLRVAHAAVAGLAAELVPAGRVAGDASMPHAACSSWPPE